MKFQADMGVLGAVVLLPALASFLLTQKVGVRDAARADGPSAEISPG